MNSRITIFILQVGNVFAVIATIVFNALVNILPLNGVNTGTVSDSYPSLFTPPGYVFSIWGVIYVLMVLFMVYQARVSQRRESYLHEIGFLYLLGAVANITWLIVFHYSYGNPTLFLLSPIPIIILLVILLLTYVRLGVGVKKVPLKHKLAVHVPVSVYLAWISLATIANIASALNIIFPDIPLSIQTVLTAMVILIALMITLLMLIRRRDIAYGLVVVWASIGIATKQAAFPMIYVTALLAVGIIAAVIILLLFRRSA
ncbi:MAG: tryptophan-rich sensory protein [Thermoproteota archaeon]